MPASIQKRSISTAVAGSSWSACFRRANANYQHDAVTVFPDLPISATAGHASTNETSHRPWLPSRPSATAPGRGTPIGGVSTWERQRRQLDQGWTAS